MVCRCPVQSWKLYLKGSPVTLEQKLCAMEICCLIKLANCQESISVQVLRDHSHITFYKKGVGQAKYDNCIMVGMGGAPKIWWIMLLLLEFIGDTKLWIDFSGVLDNNK